MSAGKVFTAEQVRAFLVDLTAVSRKHGIGVEEYYDTIQLVSFPLDAWYSVFYSGWSDRYSDLSFGVKFRNDPDDGFIAGDTEADR